MSETFPPLTEDLLADAARVALPWSRTHCRHLTPSGETCFGYHALRQYLSLFRVSTPMVNDAPFFRDVIGAAVRRGARRVLISGCVDFGVAALLQWIFAGEGATPEITALDVCETPMLLNRWYAERTGMNLRTVTSDILEYRTEHRFDVIITHSIFGLFAPETRPALVAKWHELLAPDGLFATVNRIAVPTAPDIERFDADQARAFRATVLGRAEERRRRGGLDVSADEFAAVVDAYIAQNAVHAMRSEAELVALFEGGGFRIDKLVTRGRVGPTQLTGPAMASGAGHVAQIAAIRV